MATTTTKYGFIKPQITDAADITATNGNWDKIETELASLNTLVDDNEETIENVNSNLLSITNELNIKIDENVEKLQPKISFGFDTPSGGYHGDVYIQLLEE